MKRTGLAAFVLAVLGVAPVVAPPALMSGAAAASRPAVTVKTASYNVQSVAVDRYDGDRKPWKARRAAVIDTILSERPDVIGLQEASPRRNPKKLVDGPNQFLDLRNGLRNAGGTNYRLTNAFAYNCKNPATRTKCKHKYRGASGAQRILYNTGKLELVAQGSRKYSVQENQDDPRYFAWAVFRVRSTGAKFFFANTHLANDPPTVTVRQWKQMMGWVKAYDRGLPVMTVGDFNVHKRNPIAEKLLPAMHDAGWGDTRDQLEPVNPLEPLRAEVAVNAWINSYNHASKDVRRYSYADRPDLTGNPIDWIFASNALEVKRWKVVLRFDPNTLRVIGTLPSDHNMVRADVVLR